MYVNHIYPIRCVSSLWPRFLLHAIFLFYIIQNEIKQIFVWLVDGETQVMQFMFMYVCIF